MSINFDGSIKLQLSNLDQDKYDKFVKNLEIEIEAIRTHCLGIIPLWYFDRTENKLKARNYIENPTRIIILGDKYVGQLIKILKFINKHFIIIEFSGVSYNYDYGKSGYFLTRGCGTIIVDNHKKLITHTCQAVANDSNQTHYWNNTTVSYTF